MLKHRALSTWLSKNRGVAAVASAPVTVERPRSSWARASVSGLRTPSLMLQVSGKLPTLPYSAPMPTQLSMPFESRYCLIFV